MRRWSVLWPDEKVHHPDCGFDHRRLWRLGDDYQPLDNHICPSRHHDCRPGHYGPPATTTTAPPTTATTAPATTTAAATGDVVDIFAEDFAFTPAVVTIKAGDTVRWNLSSGTHTTTSGSGTPDGMWDQVITEDIPVLVTFDQAGEYPFYCRFHGDFMSGRVVVEP